MTKNHDKINLLDPVVAGRITLKDFDFICRVCLKKFKDLISIAEYEIITMITTCTSVQISLNDDLPKHLCQNCLKALQDAFNFKQVSEISDTNLRKILQEDNLNTSFIVKPDPDEIDDNCDDSDNESIKIEAELAIENEVKIKNESDYEPTPTSLGDTDAKYHNKKYAEKLSFNNNEKSINKEKPKTCTICNKTFKKASNLVCHMVRHSDERPHQCSECGKTFKLIYALQTHKKYSHKNRNRFGCDKCEKSYQHLASLQKHISRFHEKIKPNNLCDICGKNYSSPTALKTHSFTHKPERPYQCTYCNKAFKLEKILKSHTLLMHSTNKNVYIRIPCKICGRLFSKSGLREHLKTHENNRNLIKCDQCPKQFLHQSTLQLHIRHQHENVPRIRKYLCNVCGHAVNSAASLKEHMLRHSDSKTYECDKCDMKYKGRRALIRHVQVVHLNLKPFVCSICSKNFSSKVILSNHLRTHTGERPFQCSICEKAFVQKAALSTHIKLIHTKIK